MNAADNNWNDLDNKTLAPQSFAWRDIQGQDLWQAFTPVFGSLTVVGGTTYSGRLRLVGRECQFQAQFSASTSIASVAGTDYMNLPITAKGVTGEAVMTNFTTKVAVGVCHLDVSTSRCYLPTQIASANTFNLSGRYEI